MNAKKISEKEIKVWYAAKKTAWKFHASNRDHAWETVIRVVSKSPEEINYDQ